MSIGSEVTSAKLDYALCESERWYVVYTQPHREPTAQLHLRNQGFRTFLPQYSKTVRHARKYRTSTSPLFLRYLFIALDLYRDRWRSVNGTHGVTALIMQHENPIPVKRGVVETLVASSSGDGEVHFSSELKPGQSVRLTAGPFAEQLGILQHLNDSGRVRVLLEMMGGRIPVETYRGEIAAVH